MVTQPDSGGLGSTVIVALIEARTPVVVAFSTSNYHLHPLPLAWLAHVLCNIFMQCQIIYNYYIYRTWRH